MKKIINTKQAPAAIGPYSQAVKSGDTLYISGQVPVDPATGKIVDGGIKAQTEQVLKNIGAILRTVFHPRHARTCCIRRSAAPPRCYDRNRGYCREQQIVRIADYARLF